MANLNFQQPPRAIAAGSLVGRGGGGFGFAGGPSGGPSAPPVSASAPPLALPPSLQQQAGGGGVGGGTGGQPPPSLQPQQQGQAVAAQRQVALFQQRAFADRRIGMPVNSNNAMVGVRTGLQGVVLGGAGDGSSGAPPLLDPSEFPSLIARGQGDQPHHHIPPPGSKPYVGMVKQPTAEQSEFTMSSEDFPALPGTSAGAPGTAVSSAGSGVSSGGVGTGVHLGGGGGAGSIGGSGGVQVGGAMLLTSDVPPSSQHSQPTQQHQHAQEKKGIHTYPDGKVTNIPPSMVANQYGIVGLLTFIRAAESDPELVSLALGQDLTTLGLNLNSPDNLYLTFAGPWAEAPCRPQDIDYHVPPEYMINMSIREKLAPLKLNRYKEDLLFYLFYCFVGDALQLAAASELYNREWRYHTEEKVWITQAPGVATLEKTSTYERGTYYYFDAHSWRKQTKEFHLDYSKLEGRPQLPSHFHT